MTKQADRREVVENFRNSVLFALDQSAVMTFDLDPDHEGTGATEADLPELFAVIDPLAERIAARHGVTLTDEEA